MDEIPCPRCGAPLTPDADECEGCGLTAEDVAPPSSSGVATAAPRTALLPPLMQLPQGFSWSSPDEAFAGMLEGLTSDGSTITSEQRLDWAGNPAVEVGLENRGEGGRVFALLTGDRIYLVLQGGPAVDDAGFERMRNSLQLTG